MENQSTSEKTGTNPIYILGYVSSVNTSAVVTNVPPSIARLHNFRMINISSDIEALSREMKRTAINTICDEIGKNHFVDTLDSSEFKDKAIAECPEGYVLRYENPQTNNIARVLNVYKNTLLKGYIRNSMQVNVIGSYMIIESENANVVIEKSKTVSSRSVDLMPQTVKFGFANVMVDLTKAVELRAKRMQEREEKELVENITCHAFETVTITDIPKAPTPPLFDQIIWYGGGHNYITVNEMIEKAEQHATTEYTTVCDNCGQKTCVCENWTDDLPDLDNDTECDQYIQEPDYCEERTEENYEEEQPNDIDYVYYDEPALEEAVCYNNHREIDYKDINCENVEYNEVDEVDNVEYDEVDNVEVDNAEYDEVDNVEVDNAEYAGYEEKNYVEAHYFVEAGQDENLDQSAQNNNKDLIYL